MEPRACLSGSLMPAITTPLLPWAGGPVRHGSLAGRHGRRLLEPVDVELHCLLLCVEYFHRTPVA